MTTTASEAAASTPAVDVIVDNSQAELVGSFWQQSTSQPNFYGTNYSYNNRNTVAPGPRVARWVPQLPTAGEYTVSVWLPDGNGDRTTVRHRLFHNGVETSFDVDQATAGGRWRQLGRGPLTFRADGTERLELRLADVPTRAGTLYVIADAVRFATPPPPLATAPASLAVAEGRNYVELRWDELEGADTYVVSRATDGGNLEEVAEVTGTGYLDLSLDRTKTYDFAVAGVNGAGLGRSTGRVAASLRPSVPLEPVHGLVVTTDSGKPRLTWQPSKDSTAYLVQRSIRSGGRFETIAKVTDTSFRDERVTTGRAHYVVRGTNEHGRCVLSSWQVNWTR